MVSLFVDKKQPMPPNTTDKMASSRSMWTPQNRNLLLLSSDVSYFSPQRVLTSGCPRMVPQGDDDDDDNDDDDDDDDDGDDDDDDDDDDNDDDDNRHHYHHL